jgi:hypothetical protein
MLFTAGYLMLFKAKIARDLQQKFHGLHTGISLNLLREFHWFYSRTFMNLLQQSHCIYCGNFVRFTARIS